MWPRLLSGPFSSGHPRVGPGDGACAWAWLSSSQLTVNVLAGPELTWARRHLGPRIPSSLVVSCRKRGWNPGSGLRRELGCAPSWPRRERSGGHRGPCASASSVKRAGGETGARGAHRGWQGLQAASLTGGLRMPDRLLLVSCLKPEDTDLFSALCSVSELLAGSEGVWPPAGRERATACPHPSQAWPWRARRPIAGLAQPPPGAPASCGWRERGQLG